MILLAPAKVNLCLFLGPIRERDGRHELVTVFEALSLTDRLEVTFGDFAGDHVLCPGVEGPNLVSDALMLMREAGWDAPPVRVQIDKRIPVAAGMGGGSSDAAAVLGLMAEHVDVFPLARALGADVSALVQPGLVLGTGAGDVGMERFPGGLDPHAYVVVPSSAALSTAEVYREADRLGLGRERDELAAIAGEVAASLRTGRLGRELIVNDLASAAESLCPSVRDAREAVRAAGAEQVLVSGSGPTVVGLLWGDDAVGRAEALAGTLRRRFPGSVAAVPLPGSSQSPSVP
jgi:4-diphosphocytidyl-2-C-methyl-D-erythritol kinase